MFFELPEYLEILYEKVEPYIIGCHLDENAPEDIQIAYRDYLEGLTQLMDGVM